MDNSKNKKKKKDPHQRDGEIQITVADDSYYAYGDFYPPVADGAPLDYEYVLSEMANAGITYGINAETIQETVFKVNTEKQIYENVKIASCKMPVRYVPEYIKVRKRLFERGPKRTSSKKRVDFKTYSPIVTVKKGEVLGLVIPSRAGVNGIDVRGQEISYSVKPVIVFTTGRNVEQAMNQVIASCDGQFIVKGKVFEVHESLEIRTGVDYHTGHIRFPGDIHLKSVIQDGFHIYSGGSLYSNHPIDATRIIAKENIVCNSGIIGRKGAIIRVGGKVETKFIETCTVQAKGQIFVKEGVYNSHLFTMDKIMFGQKGQMVGGDLNAMHGIVAQDIGNSKESSLKVICGIDYQVQQKIRQLKDKQNEMEEQRKKVERRLSLTESESLQALLARVNETLGTLNERIMILNQSLYVTENVAVIIRGTVYPNVEISIGPAVFTVREETKKVVFLYDEVSGLVKPVSFAAYKEKCSKHEDQSQTPVKEPDQS